MASHPFDDLALRYVLADDEAVQISVARTTVEELETAATTTPPTIRNAIGQWVGSINRWLGSQPDDEDDVISRAKALGFLARTLEFLKRDLLKPDQVKLLIAFFCSLFSSDHKAGIEASSQALGYLMDMKAFQPTSGHDIINGIVQLGSDDFKRQTPGTRLQIYQLFRRLLDHTLVANDLAYRHGDASGFMLSLVELCSNERDPQNLVVWFEIQKLFLENFSPTKEVVDEVFKAFSAYFPITLRASATPSGITVEDLKRSLRSCFSSHYRVARLAVPFLLNKLDQGEAVTVSVKVDILQTLEACLARYSDVTQGISLYTDQIWSSLKYEVRNGEVQDSIEATLRTIATLAKRLDEKDLQTFFEAAWIDISDDVSNETYTESAGRLLTAIAGSSRRSFSLSVRQAIPHITTTFRNTTAATHQVKLLGTMNALLQVRMVLSKQGGTLALGDELFGDNFFDDVYARSWSAWTQSQYSNDRLGILKRLIEGMSYIVVQQSSDGHDQRLCSEATWNRVFSWLGTPSIIFPLEGKNFLLGSQETEYDEIVNSATRALSTLAPLYPAGYQQLLERFLGSITSMSEARGPSRSEEISLIAAGSRLAFIGFGTGDTRASSLQNTMILITVFLQGFYRMTGIASQYIRPLTDLIHLAIRKPITAVTKTLDNKEALPIFSQSIEHRDWFDSLTNQIDGLPEIDKGIVGDLSKMSASLSKSTHDTPVASYQQFLLFSLSVVTQLFRCTLCLKSLPSGTNVFIDITAAMEKATGPQPGGFLHQLGQMAATVIRTLNSEDQIKLDLAREVFLFFIEPSSGQTRDDILQSVAVVPGEGAKEKWSFFKGVIQTAPLSLGILQGLHPSAMQDLYSHGVLGDLVERLSISRSTRSSQISRGSLDAILTILSNKLSASSMDERGESVRSLADGFTRIASTADTLDASTTDDLTPDIPSSLEIFQSILHFLAGDIANYNPRQEQNGLLRLVADTAPANQTMGRQLAQYFEILVSPKDYLTKENHAVTKRLKGQWIYNQVARPYLDQCFPRQATAEQQAIDDRVATNRSVAVFAIIKHLEYAVWRSESSKILLIVIRSLKTFGVSRDINTVLNILLKILDSDSDLIQEHLVALITRNLAVYEMARDVNGATNVIGDDNPKRLSKKEAAMCRKTCLQFLAKLPKTFDTIRHNLLPQRRSVLRGLSKACGDPVREVREVAIVARRDWEALS